ncbi:SH3-like domain-containing protein [Mucilaginibacter sp.]|jgi:hypothetical protein|uniref:SH3-like domain-containing protein n=1 Tax=Mucilaginibacter sp. TaxID=1882438 RepID=UPI002BC36B6D|nr:SH3-like domain-containing protein [Mucilaginibacter sp.]HTI59435.1 SH3-like domain-containing protein [Mucilaginibacter sp.]
MQLKVKYLFLAGAVMAFSCKLGKQKPSVDDLKKGSFGYDLAFLQQKDSVIVLESGDGAAKVIISPKYQGKVFTSTAEGDTGKSFGWINYKAFNTKTDPHMNAYGGEDRLWLGPEGSKFALFFKPGAKMEFANWHTPAAFDHESWNLVSKGDKQVLLSKDMQVQNYAGTNLKLRVERNITLLDGADIQKALDVQPGSAVKVVGVKTDNTIINTGNIAWTSQTGAPCLWNLDMFNPSPGVVIVIPYRENESGKVATTDYFGQIPPDRVTYKNGHLFFKADGKSRGKLGMPASRTKAIAGSYDAINNVLTIAVFDVDSKATYLNQEWTPDKDPMIGDAVNSYNDGPLADGTQMGPFYEIESVSPGAFLKPGGKLSHQHSIFHFTGDRSALDKIALKTLGVSLDDIQSAFK